MDNAEIGKALASSEMRARLVATDNVPAGSSAADFARAIAAGYASNGRIVKASGIRAD